MADMYQINEKDNVAVAAAPISKGTVVVVQHQSIVVGAVIPAGHKMAIRPIAAGEDIIKYGFPIGAAREAIAPGAWVHTHNMKSKLGNLLTYTYEPDTAVRIPGISAEIWKSRYPQRGLDHSYGGVCQCDRTGDRRSGTAIQNSTHRRYFCL